MNREMDSCKHPVDRRAFLRGAAVTGGAMMAANIFAVPAFARRDLRRFAPVKVSRDRVIREIVGLRPFRPEGYVVEAERVGNKLLVHNYGHGGAGITLSWGTATQAVELAREFVEQRAAGTGKAARAAGPRRFAVVGCA